jgi:mRNA interferase MazF
MAYLPEAGDLVWINFDPQAGREQAKNRPALVITDSDFNAATGLLVACPVTRTERPLLPGFLWLAPRHPDL